MMLMFYHSCYCILIFVVRGHLDVVYQTILIILYVCCVYHIIEPLNSRNKERIRVK